MDIKSPEERSKNMSKIRNARTKPEMFIRSLLFRHGLRFRVNYSGLPGKPDLYFTRQKAVICIHGCYWHRHPGCKYAYTPKTNQEFWLPKLDSNKKRDEKVIQQLNDQGIRVLVIWECTVRAMMKDEGLQESIVNRIINFLCVKSNMIMHV